jgi:hypothetical protein
VSLARNEIEELSSVYDALSSKTADDEAGYFHSGAEIEVLESICEGGDIRAPIRRAGRSQNHEKPDIPEEALNKDFVEPPKPDGVLQGFADTGLIDDACVDTPSRDDITPRGGTALGRMRRHMDELDLEPGQLSARLYFFSDPDNMEMFLDYTDGADSMDYGALRFDVSGDAEIEEGSDSSQKLALMRDRMDRAGIGYGTEEASYWPDNLEADYEHINSATG